MALSVTKAFPPSKGSRAPDALLRQLALLHIRTDVGGAAPTDQLPNTFNMFRSTELQRSRVVGPLIWEGLRRVDVRPDPFELRVDTTLP